ncbi:hypothetical protein FPZ12_004670 [Amycolatopsis acidicola]|uniref:DUF3040 domain-containing protein n=1 Tax=Amycolatopsis acidicola TaxID=2596893 RepID=A0A5N0VKA5_9PSEU|nr:hypothetical protein [Amycolatopsis acidicola]KAA9165784.1 hypothetical protein FPZ12_004670 [Amycolatopsis acidicola]
MTPDLPSDAATPGSRLPVVLNENFFAEAERLTPPSVRKLVVPPARLAVRMGRRPWAWRVVIAMAAVSMALFAAIGALWLTAVSILVLIVAKVLDDLCRTRR